MLGREKTKHLSWGTFSEKRENHRVPHTPDLTYSETDQVKLMQEFTFPRTQDPACFAFRAEQDAGKSVLQFKLVHLLFGQRRHVAARRHSVQVPAAFSDPGFQHSEVRGALSGVVLVT